MQEDSHVYAKWMSCLRKKFANEIKQNSFQLKKGSKKAETTLLIVTFSYICSHISKGDSPNRVKIKDATKKRKTQNNKTTTTRTKNTRERREGNTAKIEINPKKTF